MATIQFFIFFGVLLNKTCLLTEMKNHNRVRNFNANFENPKFSNFNVLLLTTLGYMNKGTQIMMLQ